MYARSVLSSEDRVSVVTAENGGAIIIENTQRDGGDHGSVFPGDSMVCLFDAVY